MPVCESYESEPGWPEGGDGARNGDCIAAPPYADDADVRAPPRV
jgi:hypothetical protein